MIHCIAQECKCQIRTSSDYSGYGGYFRFMEILAKNLTFQIANITIQDSEPNGGKHDSHLAYA